MSTLASRVAVVTGGASGMGEATCRELGRRGLSVAVLDVNEEAAQRVTEDLRAAGSTAIGVGADRLRPSRRRAGVREGSQRAGARLSVLVTSAGMFGFSPFAEITPESWNKIIDVT